MNELALDNELTIFNALQMKNELLTYCQENDDITLNMSAVSELDGSGLQLLISTKKYCEQNNKRFSIIEHSQTVIDVFKLMGADSYFDDPILLKSEA